MAESTPTAGGRPAAAGGSAHSPARLLARLAAYELLRTAQDAEALEPPASSTLPTLVDTADLNHWPEVAVLARVAAGILADGDGEVSAALYEDIRLRAESSPDPAVLALSYAFHAWGRLRLARRTGQAAVGVERDLITAAVLLGREAGGSLERATAHNLCGIGFSLLGMWELAVTHFEAARAIDPAAAEPELVGRGADLGAAARAARYNLALLQTVHACACRVVGDEAGVAAHAGATVELLAGIHEDPAGWVGAWLAELHGCGLLCRALLHEDVADQAAAALRAHPAGAAVAAWVAAQEAGSSAPGARPGIDPEGQPRAGETVADPTPRSNDRLHLPVGGPLLALALSLGDARRAAAVAEVAVEVLAHASPPLVNLALTVAAELEGDRAAVRLARSQSQKQWNSRRRRIESMESLIRAERLRARSRELEQHAHVDELTGLANRRGFYRRLDELLSGGTERVGLLVVDIDRFKEINDRYGHPAGDRALRRLGGVLAGLVRPRDTAARVGGDEFFVLLEGTGLALALDRAERILDAVAPGPDGDGRGLSVTIGVASGPVGEFQRLLAEADAALYRGKATGGRRVVAGGANRRI